ncbi:MAG: AEC family transporter [Saccharofermentanales bacterium]
MNATSLALVMFLLILVGYTARKLKIVDGNFGRGLSMFLYDFVFPAIIVSSMSIPVDKNDLENSLHLIIISIGMIILMFAISFAAKIIMKTKDSFAGIMSFAMMFPNFTFMAYPVMESLFPDKGLFYISIFTVPVRLIIYVAGPLLIKPKDIKLSSYEMIKTAAGALLTPPVLAVPVGLAVYFLGITFPVPIASTLEFLGRTATPMGMAVTGILLAEAPIRKIFADKRLYVLSFMRLVMAPLIVFLVLFKIPLDPVVFKMAVIYSALPAAAATTVIAIQYKGDAQNAAGSVFLTTVFSVVSVPVCAMLLDLVV